MKNTFKYITALVAFSAIPLISGLSISAQNLNDETYLESNGIAYAKRAIHNNDGTYTIDLETFVTGGVHVEYDPIPADIVLVLDVSGSMSQNMTSYTYNVATVTALYGSNYNNNTPTQFYYKYNDRYFPVYIGRGGNWGNRRYYLFFRDNYNTTRYINTSGQVVTAQPTNVTNQSTNLLASNVTLYTRTTGDSVQKLAALKTAVLKFIDIIDQNDIDNAPDGEERLGNQIAIVTYSTSANILAQLTPLSDKSELISVINGLNANGGTNAHLGMQNALTILNGSDSHLKTTVMFTDGDPGLYGDWTGSNRNDTWSSANNTINYASQIKDLAVESDDPKSVVYSKVYTVGVFTDPSDYTKVYMGKTSSNYKKDATSMGSYGSWNQTNIWSNGNGTALPAAQQKYSFNATSADDLNDIFESIAEASGGSGNTDVSGGTAVTVDVVSSSFSVPKEFEEASDVVTVLVAPCNGKTTIDGKEYLTFGEEKDATEYDLPAITPSISVADNTVSATGFDFSANWCGYNESTHAYQGYKQIIRFVITINEDAVGGPNVETNDSESGIYLAGSDEPLVKFNRPTVKLPVQIWLQKQGLRPGDSAVLTLYKSPFVENFNPETATWENFTKVVVSYEDMYKEVDAEGNPTGLVKIVGLDPDYFYKLKEDAWAFGYTYQDGGIQYTVGDNVQNPFVFVNVPKPVKYDEASLRNVFNEKKAAADSGSESGK